jgi:hypothetical protein
MSVEMMIINPAGAGAAVFEQPRAPKTMRARPRRQKYGARCIKALVT